MMASVTGISVFFMICGVPMVWNSLRQLLMSYTFAVLQNTQSSGTGVVFNYEYYIVNFMLTLNNCVNFYMYLFSGSTWRKGFFEYCKMKLFTKKRK